jgi:hypothetical protein
MYVRGVFVIYVLNFPAGEMAGIGVSKKKAGLLGADRRYVANSTVSIYIGAF